MSQSSDDRRPTSVLVGASDIMRTLSFPRLTTLYYVYDCDEYIQQEIADILGYTRSPISTHLKTMAEDLPVALVTKQGRRYTVTEAGKTVLRHVRRMLSGRGINLHSVDWTDDTDTEELADQLTPFGDARSTAPFLLLYSLGTRGTMGNRIEPFGTPQPVYLEDTVHDVETRLDERSESITRSQMQNLLLRFDDANTVEYDNPEVVLTEKGHEQANLLEQLIQLLESQHEPDDDQESSEESRPPQSSLTDAFSSEYSETQATSTSRSAERHGMDNIAQQSTPRGYFDRGRASLDGLQESPETPAIIPAYRLCSAADDEPFSASDGDTGDRLDSRSESAPVLPLTTLTLNELTDVISQLAGEYDRDVEFEPYWALQTESGVQPLSPARLPLEEASHRAWKIINEAHDVWDEQSR